MLDTITEKYKNIKAAKLRLNLILIVSRSVKMKMKASAHQSVQKYGTYHLPSASHKISIFNNFIIP